MKFFALTDLHYADREKGNGDRCHSQSLNKLREALKYSDDCDFIVNLGDTADDFSDSRPQTVLLNEIKDEFIKNGKKFYTIIGNHDTSVDKNVFCCLMQMKNRYYSFETEDYTVMMLDSSLNDVNNPYPDGEIDWANCYIDDEQKQWIKDTIDKSKKKVLVFTHALFIMSEREIINNHIIKNRDEIIDIFEKSGKVLAVFSGHYHPGAYGYCNGIHYITFASMCIGEHNSFAVVNIENEKIDIQGFGNIKSFTL